MQIISRSSSMALVLLVLVGSGDCLNLRFRMSSPPIGDTIEAVAGAIALKKTQSPPEKVHDDTSSAAASYEVVEKSSISRNGTLDCLCKIGTFWHWRINKCVTQGAWAYECGFFPAEHHDKVCMDSLKCEVLEQPGAAVIKYGGHPGAVPGSCQHCDKADKCPTGEKRHEDSCLKEYQLGGSACQTVRVTVTATASAQVTEKITKTSEASATATATAKHEATVKAGATKEATAEGNVTASATKEATASATKEATAEGNASVKAEGSGEARANASATEEGSAEGKACVTLDEVKDFMELQNVPNIGAVLSTKVVSTGDKLAFDRAYAKALAAAREAGLLNAQEAAKALASAEAREHAGLEAKAKADEAAAWKAEAGAKKDAQEKAKAEALKQAEEAARQKAEALAKKAAEAAAKAAAAKKAAEEAAAKKAADAAAKAAAAAKAEADAKAAAEAAAAAKAGQEAIGDYLNKEPTQAPIEITTAAPTNAPRKITAEQVAAKLP